MEPTIRFSFTQGVSIKVLQLILGLDGIERVDGLRLRDDGRFAAMLVRFDTHETADLFKKIYLAQISGATDTSSPDYDKHDFSGTASAPGDTIKAE